MPYETPMDVVVPIPNFYFACHCLEPHTLIGYFVGRTPLEIMLWDWVSKSWATHGVENLTKGFFLFSFVDVSHVQNIF